jgi:PAS domain S-box-containing protein
MSVSEAAQLVTLNAEFVRLIEARNEAAAAGDKNRRDNNSIEVQLAAGLGEGRRFHPLLEALPTAVYATDAAGRLIFYNHAAAKLWGRRPELGKEEWCGSWRLYWPDGRPMPHDQCPMAVALKEQRPLKGVEALAERPDGTRVPFLAYPTPLVDESGALIGALNMLVDITERKRAEHDGQLLASIVESSDDAIVSKDLDGTIVSWNKGAERLFGYSAEEVRGKPITILIPPDRLDEEPGILARIRRGERVEHYETVRRCKDGSLIDISLTVSPVKNAEGRIVGASKIARDITDRRRAQEQQNLLLREMSHRVKNLFAVASGVVTLSARSASTPEDMAKSIRDRLGALTRAHELTRPGLIDTTEKCSRDTTLHALARTILSPYLGGPEEQDRIIVNGPDVSIGGSAVTSLALLLHEFATNAAKYGALASSSGSVRVDWFADKDELALTWREQGGPAIEGHPECEGFGSLLARRIVSGQFGGRLSHDWEPEGVTIHLSVPIEQLTK